MSARFDTLNVLERTPYTRKLEASDLEESPDQDERLSAQQAPLNNGHNTHEPFSNIVRWAETTATATKQHNPTSTPIPTATEDEPQSDAIATTLRLLNAINEKLDRQAQEFNEKLDRQSREFKNVVKENDELKQRLEQVEAASKSAEEVSNERTKLVQKVEDIARGMTQLEGLVKSLQTASNTHATAHTFNATTASSSQGNANTAAQSATQNGTALQTISQGVASLGASLNQHLTDQGVVWNRVDDKVNEQDTKLDLVLSACKLLLTYFGDLATHEHGKTNFLQDMGTILGQVSADTGSAALRKAASSVIAQMKMLEASATNCRNELLSAAAAHDDTASRLERLVRCVDAEKKLREDKVKSDTEKVEEQVQGLKKEVSKTACAVSSLTTVFNTSIVAVSAQLATKSEDEGLGSPPPTPVIETHSAPEPLSFNAVAIFKLPTGSYSSNTDEVPLRPRHVVATASNISSVMKSTSSKHLEKLGVTDGTFELVKIQVVPRTACADEDLTFTNNMAYRVWYKKFMANNQGGLCRLELEYHWVGGVTESTKSPAKRLKRSHEEATPLAQGISLGTKQWSDAKPTYSKMKEARGQA